MLKLRIENNSLEMLSRGQMAILYAERDDVRGQEGIQTVVAVTASAMAKPQRVMG
jgi:hypothetical protein